MIMQKTFTLHNIHKLIGYHLRILIPPDDEIRMFGVWDVYFEEESYHIKLGWVGDVRLEIDNHMIQYDPLVVRIRLQMVGCKTKYGWIRFEDMGNMDGFISALGKIQWSSYPLRHTVYSALYHIT